MKKSEIIALIEQTAIAHHESEMLWFEYAKDAEDENTAKMYKRFAMEFNHKENALCDLLDKITGMEGHGVLLDESCKYMVTVI